MHTSCAPGMASSHSDEQKEHGPGIYAVPLLPSMGPMPGLASGDLIPLKYKIPLRPNDPGAVNQEINRQGQQQQPLQQRQVIVRRFQFAIQIDLILILKLAAVIFLFHQDGSRQRLILLVFFAALIYLHQTGAFAPLVRWLRRAGTVPQQQADVRLENAPIRQEQADNQLPEGPAAEDENHQPVGNEDPVENDNRAEVGRGNGFDLWRIANEIKLIVIGFVTSLFPGFHHHHD